MSPSTNERLRAVAARLDDLAARSMRLWLDAGLDPLGGAHGFLDRRFRPQLDPPDEPAGPSGEVRGDQSLVQQARHLYAYTLYAERRPEATPAGGRSAAQFAHEIWAHLLAAFERADTFVHLRARDGAVRSLAVQLYAQAFGIFALATYGRVFEKAEACQKALRHFEALDARLHDERNLGYDQRADGGWLPFVSAPPDAAKCTNSHIHALEMTTALLRAVPTAAVVRLRTLELVELIATRVRQKPGYLQPFFDLGWRPLGPPRVSYGHDLETAWLLLDALDVLESVGHVPKALVLTAREAALSMVRHAVRTGWDPLGGFFDQGVPEGTTAGSMVLVREKVWWAQVEALPGLYRAFRLTFDLTLLDRLEQTAAFLAERAWDQEFGGYFWSVDSAGRPLGRGDHKGELWKTPYHDIRACLLTADWIAEDVSALAAP